MELKFRRNPDYQSLQDEVTPEKMFIDRRHLLAAGGLIGAGSILGALPACSEPQQGQPAVTAAKPAAAQPAPGAALKAAKTSYAVADQATIQDGFEQYCNFYEFGTSKNDPARYASLMTVSPWKITVEGETDAPGAYDLTSLIDYSDRKSVV